MQIIKKSIFFLLVPLLAFTMHKYYVSMTKIKYVEEKRAVQITMRFFIDDVEKAMNSRFKKDFHLATKEELDDTDKFLNLYIHQKFGIKINDQLIEYKYLGKEYKNNVGFFYLESTDVDPINSIEVRNQMLMESFEEQQNFIKLYINNEVKTMILLKENVKEMLNY